MTLAAKCVHYRHLVRARSMTDDSGAPQDLPAPDPKHRDVGLGLLEASIGFFYIYWCAKRARLRLRLELHSGWFATLATFALVIDVTKRYFPFDLSTIEKDLTRWGLSGLLIALKVFYISVFLAVLWKSVRDQRDRQREFYFTEASRRIVAALRGSNGSQNRVQELLSVFARTFGRRVRATVWAPGNPSQSLLMKHSFPPDEEFPRDLRFEKEEGVAGWCWGRNEAVYVPRRRFRHAILLDLNRLGSTGGGLYGVAPDLYKDYSPAPFKSVLAVPITRDSSSCRAVLCFDSPTGNAFKRMDIAMACVYGVVLGAIVDEVVLSADADTS